MKWKNIFLLFVLIVLLLEVRILKYYYFSFIIIIIIIIIVVVVVVYIIHFGLCPVIFVSYNVFIFFKNVDIDKIFADLCAADL